MVKDAETSVEDTWKTVVELQKEGKIKYLGLSEADEEYIRRVSKVAKINALQIEVSTISGGLTRILTVSCSFRRSPLTSKPTGFWRHAGSSEYQSSVILLLVEAGAVHLCQRTSY